MLSPEGTHIYTNTHTGTASRWHGKGLLVALSTQVTSHRKHTDTKPQKRICNRENKARQSTFGGKRGMQRQREKERRKKETTATKREDDHGRKTAKRLVEEQHSNRWTTRGKQRGRKTRKRLVE